MLLALLLSIFALCLWGMKFNLKGFNDDYLSKGNTNSIKGIFILLIVLKHSCQYISDSGYAYDRIGDSWFLQFFWIIAQLVVVMFLFYSGYGVGESFKYKGAPYVKAMPRHRILGTLLNFDVAVLIFIVVDLLLGIELTANQCLLSLTGWKSVGNSNWYIFVILVCYLMTYVTLRIPLSRPRYRVAVLFVLCLFWVVLLWLFKLPYWYDTILCYPLGFMSSTYKDKIEAHFRGRYWICVSVLLVALLLTHLWHYVQAYDWFQLRYNAMSMVFALLMLALTMKVRINNRILIWFGKMLFPVYIYMRLPMLVMKHETPAFVGTYPAAFILISLAVTVGIACCYRHWEIKL